MKTQTSYIMTILFAVAFTADVETERFVIRKKFDPTSFCSTFVRITTQNTGKPKCFSYDTNCTNKGVEDESDQDKKAVPDADCASNLGLQNYANRKWMEYLKHL